MSNANDFVIENGVLTKYVGSGGDVVIPEGVNEIGAAAFYMCRWLNTVVVPENVATIGRQAFHGCTSLKCITIPNSVTHIGEWAFYDCKELKEAYIPQTVQSFWENVVFIDCPLEVFHGPLIPIEEYHYKAPRKNALAVGYAEMSESGIIFEEEIAQGYAKQIKSQKKKLYALMVRRPLLLRYMLKNKVIPVKDMQECLDLAAAANNPELTAMLLAYQNGTYATDDQKAKEAKQTSLKMPTEAELMKKQWSTKKLPDGTLMISAYKGEEGRITIPGSIGKGRVTALDKELFSAEKLGRPDVRKAFYAEKLEKITISADIREIPDGAFLMCDALKEVNIPESAGRIGKKAFSCCGLEKARIPGNIACVEERAFYNCLKLLKVILEDGVVSIGKEAFMYNFRLESIRIPDSVERIGEDAFYMCNKLTIHAPAGSYAEIYAKENNIPFVAE